MPGFYSHPIMLDGVAAIKDSILSPGWNINPESKIVGFISEDEQITAFQELKKKSPNKDVYEFKLKKFDVIWKENW